MDCNSFPNAFLRFSSFKTRIFCKFFFFFNFFLTIQLINFKFLKSKAFRDAKLDHMYINLFYITLFFMILRMLSFCLEKAELYSKDLVKENENVLQLSNYTLIDLLLYTFYPTFLFIAPFITFANFNLTFVSRC